MPRILIVDDEPGIREMFGIFLEDGQYEVDLVDDGKAAIERIQTSAYDLVITDLMMPEADGMAVLRKVKEISPDTLVVMITAFGTTESAVAAIKEGAYDYITKPFKMDEMRLLIDRAMEKNTLRRENQQLKRKVGLRKGFQHFVGRSPEMLKIFDLVERVAAGRSSVLIVGESGTGKELVAKAIHENSPRAEKPFVSINCAAIPENLIESELFGYIRGAFTGATGNRMGLFEAAHHGTFFMDEIAELPLPMQAKLLRVLQEKSVRRIGSTTSSPIDVRILSATNRDLEAQVRSGQFREDLFYRLNVIQIRMPALRDRREDIPLFAKHFVDRFAQEQKKVINAIHPEALHALEIHDYPGNVRELENILEQAVTFEASDQLTLASLPEKIRERTGGRVPTVEISGGDIALEDALDSFEKRLLLDALRQAGGVKKRAAEILKLSFRSFRYRLLKHGLDAGGEED